MKNEEDLVKISSAAGCYGIETSEEMKAFMKLLGADCVTGLGMQRQPRLIPFIESLLGIETAYAASPCDYVTIVKRMTELLDKMPPGTNVDWILHAESTMNKLNQIKGKLPEGTYESLVNAMNRTATVSEKAAVDWMQGRISDSGIVVSNFNGGAIAEAEALLRLAGKGDVEVIQWNQVLTRPNGQTLTDIDIVTKEAGQIWLTEVKSNAAKWKVDSMNAYIEHAKSLGSANIRFYYENQDANYLKNITEHFRARGYSSEKGNFQMLPFEKK